MSEQTEQELRESLESEIEYRMALYAKSTSYPTITECDGMRFKSVQFYGVISLSELINSSITDRWSVLKVELNTVDTGTLKLWQWAVKP